MLRRSLVSTMTRRKFLALGALALPAAAATDARWVEPTALQIKTLHRGTGCRFVQFSDVHYKGNARYAAEVVRTINELAPDFVCFTGDLVEQSGYLEEALSFIAQIKCPVYGIPGNHDYWSHSPFEEYARVFAGTGGAWLVDRSIVLPEHGLELIGMAIRGIHAFGPPLAARRILLTHYPVFADNMAGRGFDLMLAGHSHGGQIRLPLYGALLVPLGVGPYDLGYYDTPGGPLYVNGGIGTYRIPMRLNCRPEITVVNI